MIQIYNFCMYIFWPLISAYINRRKKIGKEDILRFNERIGIYHIPRPEGKLIWFHAASVGESISIINLIEDLSKQYNILVTSGTVNSAKVLATRLPKNAIHQFVPIDKKSYVQNFLNHFKPDLAFFAESEIWPNLLYETKQRNIKIIIGSARITPKPLYGYLAQQLFFKSFMPLVDLIIPQDLYTKEFYDRIAPSEKITDIYNLKLGNNPLPYNSEELDKLRNILQGRTVFLAASTHDNEEDLIAECHYNLRKKHPNLLTIIAPRHPNRANEILCYIAKHNLTVSQRSKNQEIQSTTDIYLADTIGEMGLLFRLAPISFIGGTLMTLGGHNILEPAQLNSLIIVGPYTQNFTDIIKIFSDNKALTQIENHDDLAKKLTYFFNNQEEITKQVAAQNNIMSEFSQIRPSYIKMIEQLL